MTDPAVGSEVKDEFRRLLLEPQLQAARHRYVAAVVEALAAVESWIAIDSWLGGGKITDIAVDEVDASTYAAFRGVSTVIAMSAELAESAAVMAERRRYYAVGAVIRQLIECEYLLTLFTKDSRHAADWLASSPEQIRATFTPAKMRKRLNAFSSQGYWGHCDMGGHPAPKGAPLLESMDPGQDSWPYSSASLLIDLGLHLRRIWRATDRLLEDHHARYTEVRRDAREKAEIAWSRWLDEDPALGLLTTVRELARSDAGSDDD